MNWRLADADRARQEQKERDRDREAEMIAASQGLIDQSRSRHNAFPPRTIGEEKNKDHRKICKSCGEKFNAAGEICWLCARK